MALNTYIVNNSIANAKNLEYLYLAERLEIQGEGFKFSKNTQPRVAVRYDNKVHEWSLLGLEAPSMENLDEMQFYFFCENPGHHYDGEIINLLEYDILPGELLRIADALPSFPLDIDKEADLWKIFGGNWTIHGDDNICLRIDPETETISEVAVIGGTACPGIARLISGGMDAWKSLKKMKSWVTNEKITTMDAVNRFAENTNFDLPF